VRGIDTDGSGDFNEFDDVKTAFAAFVFGDERLRAPQFSGEVNLGEAGRIPGLDKKEAEAFVVSCENRFRHLTASVWTSR
jgi:hypothetical protein